MTIGALFLFHDLRPAKDGMRHALNRYESGAITLDAAVAEIRSMAESIHDLNTEEYTGHQAKLLAAHNIDRARRLVDCLGHRTLRPWVLPTVKLVSFAAKWSLILGAVYLMVRCAVGAQ